MKTVWITRSFLDYRVPVYKELNGLLDGKLVLIYNAEVVPERVQAKAAAALGQQAIGLRGEWRFGRRLQVDRIANSAIRLPWQPGLLQAVRRHRPEVLITDGFFQWTAAALWLRMTARVPHVLCYERTAYTERNAQWFRRFYRRRVLRYVDSMCCNGRLSGEYTCQLGMPADRITYGHMAADTDGLSAAVQRVDCQRIQDLRRRLGVRDICLLYVGQLIPRKGLQPLLDAWSRMQSGLASQASLVLVGDGPERPRLEDFCKANDLNNVHFVGSIDYDSLAPYYAAADAFVIPTLEDNWSLVVPEAMACGLPILCSKYNGCWPELVHDGRNGWVFDPLSLCDTVRCLEECLRSKSKLPAMGQESLALVKGHTPQKAAAAVFEACRLALAMRASSLKSVSPL
jgi:glycosyltransferase involved in cell wall biosynthesis